MQKEAYGDCGDFKKPVYVIAKDSSRKRRGLNLINIEKRGFREIAMPEETKGE